MTDIFFYCVLLCFFKVSYLLSVVVRRNKVPPALIFFLSYILNQSKILHSFRSFKLKNFQNNPVFYLSCKNFHIKNLAFTEIVLAIDMSCLNIHDQFYIQMNACQTAFFSFWVFWKQNRPKILIQLKNINPLYFNLSPHKPWCLF